MRLEGATTDWPCLITPDMALVQNSYLYHTRLDLPEFIEPGALQHMGENTIALLEYLTSPETLMGNSPTAQKLPKSATKSMIYFSGLGGYLFFIYTRAQATLAYGILAALAVIILGDRIDWTKKRLYVTTSVGVGGTFVAAMLGANLSAAVVALVMKKTMVW